MTPKENGSLKKHQRTSAEWMRDAQSSESSASLWDAEMLTINRKRKQRFLPAVLIKQYYLHGIWNRLESVLAAPFSLETSFRVPRRSALLYCLPQFLHQLAEVFSVEFQNAAEREEPETLATLRLAPSAGCNEPTCERLQSRFRSDPPTAEQTLATLTAERQCC